MKRNALAASLSQALFCAVLLPVSLAATAQNQAPDAGTAGDPKQLDTVVVQAEIAYRDRTEDIAPTLAKMLGVAKPEAAEGKVLPLGGN